MLPSKYTPVIAHAGGAEHRVIGPQELPGLTTPVPGGVVVVAGVHLPTDRPVAALAVTFASDDDLTPDAELTALATEAAARSRATAARTPEASALAAARAEHREQQARLAAAHRQWAELVARYDALKAAGQFDRDLKRQIDDAAEEVAVIGTFAGTFAAPVAAADEQFRLVARQLWHAEAGVRRQALTQRRAALLADARRYAATLYRELVSLDAADKALAGTDLPAAR